MTLRRYRGSAAFRLRPVLRCYAHPMDPEATSLGRTARTGPEKASDPVREGSYFRAQSVRARPIAQLLADELRGVGAWLRPELLHAAAEHFGDVEVAVLVHRQRMGSAKLAGVRAGLSPSVLVIPVQVVLEDAVRPAVRYPQHLIRRDQMSVGPGHDRAEGVVERRPFRTGREHVEELALLVEDLDAPVPAIDDEEAAVGGEIGRA